MSEPEKSIELDDARHQRIQHWEWIAERMGWGAIGLILLAALLGLLGPGLLSHRVVSSSNGRLSVDYDHFQRNEAPFELVIRLNGADAEQDRVRLAISRTFTDAVTIDNVAPEPETVEMEADRLVYTFLAPGPAQDRKVVVRYQNHQIGSMSYGIAIEGGPRVSLSHFVWP